MPGTPPKRVTEEGLIQTQIDLPPGISRIYIPEKNIKDRVAVIAEDIVSDQEDYIHALVILKGGVVFASDLFREISRISDIDIYHSFLKASSYSNSTESTHEVVLSHDIHEIKGKNILILEDIIDTGKTMQKLKEYLLSEREARSVKTCTLLDKPVRRAEGITIEPDYCEPDYCGFLVDNYFLVGYGLDYGERFRQLPYIAVLDEAQVRS